jgi:hypothetical protein
VDCFVFQISIEEAPTIEIEQKQVPESVFGGLKTMIEESKSQQTSTTSTTNTSVSNVSRTDESSDTRTLGAKERLRRKRGI